ncbi:MAG: outer membrane PBP1 activator LpoA protein [Burkholderiaceae bacterium]|jgi:outer membrane PBP1 activator LpoA protein
MARKWTVRWLLRGLTPQMGMAMLVGLCATAGANTTAAAGLAGLPPAAGELIVPTSPRQAPRVALMLPLRSEALGPAAEAVRAGFMAGYERDRNGATLTVYTSGEGIRDVLATYAEAALSNDIVVGPLSRTDVTTLIQNDAIRRPTIALSPPDGDSPVPKQLLVIGLSVEDEARQVASWAGAGKKDARALVLTGSAAWQRRTGKAYTAQWQQLGLESQTLELLTSGTYFDAANLASLKKQLQADKPTLVLLALDAAQARQVRAVVGSDLPLYGISQLNPFVPQERTSNTAWPDLDGLRLLDLPWMIEPTHPAVMVYPRVVPVPDQPRSADLERLYALGIDAWRIANEVGAHHPRFVLDGVSGKLAVTFDGSETSFRRTSLQAVFRDGTVAPLVPAY